MVHIHTIMTATVEREIFSSFFRKALRALNKAGFLVQSIGTTDYTLEIIFADMLDEQQAAEARRVIIGAEHKARRYHNISAIRGWLYGR